MTTARYIITLGICLVIAGGVTAQVMPKKPTPQQFAGYHVKEQQNWQIKQLPANSVTYKFNTNYNAGRAYNFNLNKQQPVVPSVPKPAINSLQPGNKYILSPYLQLYMKQDQQQLIKWQKQSWWRDPAQAPGAELLKSFLKK